MFMHCLFLSKHLTIQLISMLSCVFKVAHVRHYLLTFVCETAFISVYKVLRIGMFH